MSRRGWVNITRLAIIVTFLLAWQFLPQIDSVRSSSNLFNPFFVSSPERVVRRLWDMVTGANGSFLVWSYIRATVVAAFFGLAIGFVGGAGLGLALSNSAFASAVLRPIVIAANATPRIALVPVIILLFGPTLRANIVLAFLVVFFLTFFNAYEGGTSVTPEMIYNAKLQGANRWRIMWYIRRPWALAWTIAGLPITLTFAILTVVTAEVLTGYPGMGRLLSTASQTADASLTFAIVVLLGTLGVVTVVGADLVRARVLHWWGK